MRVDDLLNEIEPLTYNRRCERLAGLRRLAGDPALAVLLDGLGARPPRLRRRPDPGRAAGGAGRPQ
ncbi:hypothetical protein [Actinoallomurus vinaceus]